MTSADFWIPAAWSAPGNVVAGCSLRTGGVSTGVYASLNLGEHVGDDPDAVRTNRQRLATACNLPSEPLWLSQVHGTKVLEDPTRDAEADASLTRQVDRVCVVMVADCLPVLLVSEDGREVAAAHAGWRGLSAGVLENTVCAFNAPPQRILAWLGPAISQAAFEVGGEVREAFLQDDLSTADCFVPNERGRWQADLYALARRRLQTAGVHQVFGGGWCTHEDSARFFSYRRDGQCGRMAAFVFRNA